MNKLLIFITLIFFSTVLNAQVVNGKHNRLAKYVENEKWEDCAFRADRMLMQDKNKNDAEIYLYLAYSYSKIFLMCLNDNSLLDKVPDYANAYKNAIKNATLAIKKDKKNQELFPANNDLLVDIIISGTYYIDNYIDKKQYSKAKSFLGKMRKAYTDNNLDFLYGVLCLMTSDSETGQPMVDASIEKIRANTSSKNDRTEYMMIDGFDMYFSYLNSQEPPMIDSARNWINIGLELFSKNEILVYDKFILDNPETSNKKPENTAKILSLQFIKDSSIDDKDSKDDDFDDDDDDDE